LHHVLRRLVEIHLLSRRQVLAHLHAAERQQVVDEAGHALGLLAHHAQETIARSRIVLGRPLQGFDESPQGGKWRAQLVAGISDEIGAPCAPVCPAPSDRGWK
jgi:hypothetical protein